MKYHFQIKNVLATAALLAGLSTLGPALGQSGTNPQQRAVEEPRPALSARSANDEAFKTQETASSDSTTRQTDRATATERAISREATGVGNSSRSEPNITEAGRYYEAGVALAATPSLDLAIEKFKQAISLEPTNAQAHFALGIAYSKSNRYKDASESFKRAARLRPDWAEAHLRLGQMYYVLDMNSQALDEHKRLLNLNQLMADTLLRTIKGGGKVTSLSKVTNDVPVNRQPSSLKGKVQSREQSTSGLVSKKENVAVGNQTSAVAAHLVKQTPGNIQDSVLGVATPTVATNGMTSTSTTVSAATAVSTIAERKAPNEKTNPDQNASSTYRVGVGDVLDIRLLNSATNRSTLYTVIDGGLIDFPLAGDPMPVAGRTTEEIQSLIGNELKRRGVQENAQLSVGVRDYTSHQVIITGLVGSPGTKRLRREAVPLYVILAEAQPRLDAVRATIISARRQPLTVDLSDTASANVLVRPGDLITIAARPQEFYYIGGPVNYPGQKPYQPGITLLQAVLAAGGFARSGDAAEISREGWDKRLSTTKYDLRQIKAGKVQDPRLEPGDRVEVFK